MIVWKIQVRFWNIAGTGDPELITLKALKALNAVDVIFVRGRNPAKGG
ncbi:MAG: SAM-dependent methyltransferase [Odoribacter splanchnicus]